MNISFKQYLVEVEKQQVLGFADLLDKEIKSGVGFNITTTQDELNKVEKDQNKIPLYYKQIGQAKSNPRMGQQMAKNLRVAVNRPDYEAMMKGAATVPHFVVDLQKSLQGLTGDMLKHIGTLSKEKAQSILDGSIKSGENEFMRNIIKYKNNPKVKEALENVVKSGGGSGFDVNKDFGEFLKTLVSF